MLITTPNPGTISLPFGIAISLITSFLSVADVVVVPLCVVDAVDVDDWVVTVVVVISVIAGAMGAVTDSIGVDWALMDLLITELGFVGLMGEIGEVGLLMFVAVITHVSDVVDQAVHVGKPYGSKHCEVLDSAINPLYPA